ncbi:hypothetical protein Sjap_008122 [Stephania japonica]|uniref:Uncharacterized protein n=1 Tax=Stephania japonica TaxID=461633 RepID=A0AAP0PAJ9_9MAGN
MELGVSNDDEVMDRCGKGSGLRGVAQVGKDRKAQDSVVAVGRCCAGGDDRRQVRGPTWSYTRASIVLEPQYVAVLWWNVVVCVCTTVVSTVCPTEGMFYRDEAGRRRCSEGPQNSDGPRAHSLGIIIVDLLSAPGTPPPTSNSLGRLNLTEDVSDRLNEDHSLTGGLDLSLSLLVVSVVHPYIGTVRLGWDCRHRKRPVVVTGVLIRVEWLLAAAVVVAAMTGDKSELCRRFVLRRECSAVTRLVGDDARRVAGAPMVPEHTPLALSLLPPWTVPLPSNRRDMGVVEDPITFMVVSHPPPPERSKQW